MNNPYQAPSSTPAEVKTAPAWYNWFLKVYWPMWMFGTGLIICSWVNLVDATVGWAGLPSQVPQPWPRTCCLPSRA